MLNGNLSTRPFFNERLVALALGAVALLVVLATAYNASRLMTLSSERSELRARIDRDDQAAAAARAHAQTLQQTIDRAALMQVSASTREANDLIDQRTFSWTVFFSLIEKTMPLDMRLAVVSPSVEKGVFRVTMTVVARSLDDVDAFTDELARTGAFYDIVPADKQAKEDGTYSAVLAASYLAPGGTPTPKAAPAAVRRP